MEEIRKELKGEGEEVRALLETIASLKEQLQAKTREAEEYLDHLKRLYAEFDNFRKRMIREQTKILEYAKEDLIAKLLPIVDDLERALKSTEVVEELPPLLEGIRMVHKLLLDQLMKEGLRRIEAREGDPFNPELHEAIEVVGGRTEGEIVVELFEPGYFFKKKLLRPAKVKVAKGTSPSSRGGGGGNR